MNTRHGVLMCAAVVGSIVFGCQAPPNGAKDAPQVAVPPAAMEPQPVAPQADGVLPDSADLIARRAERYTADLEAALARRDARTSASDVTPVPVTPVTPVPTVINSAPSAVQWTEPPASVTPVTPAAVTPAPAPAPVAPVLVAAVVVPSNAPVVVAESNAPKSIASPVVESTDTFENRLLQKLKENPRDASAQLDWQLLQFVRDRQTPDLSAMSDLPEEDREVLSAVMDGLVNFRAQVRNDRNMLFSKKVRPLIEATNRLRSQAELHLPTVQLCTRVDGFGVYEPIDPPRFAAGKEASAVLYTEVANFSSLINDKQKWETKLTHEAVLYTESGLPVWQEKPQSITDASRNRRTDFYVARIIKLPANLTIGRYLLKITVTDAQASRVAESTVPVTVVAQ